MKKSELRLLIEIGLFSGLMFSMMWIGLALAESYGLQ